MIRYLSALNLGKIQIVVSDLGLQGSDQEGRFSLVQLHFSQLLCGSLYLILARGSSEMQATWLIPSSS